MAWSIEISETALKDLKKLDRQVQADIVRFLRERVSEVDNPRSSGKALKGDLKELWRYRVGDYRIICNIIGSIITVLLLRVRHRKEVYRR